MPPRGMEFLQQVMSRGGGLVIIGGIRGSGRSATLEALAGHMSAKPVLMIEDRPGPALKGVDRISADNQNLETLIPHILAQGYEGLAVENAMPGDLPLLLRTASAGLSVAVTAWGRSAPEIVEAFSTDKSTRLELGNLLEGIIHQERTKVPCHCHLPGGCEECLHTGVADTCCRFTLLCPAPALRDSLRRGMDREIILKDCRESILIDPDHPIYNLNNGGYYA